MHKKTIRVGFIGLGKIGSGICANIQRAGYDLTVYNRTLEKTQPFAEKGAKVAYSIKTLVAQTDVIFSSLLDDQSVMDLCHDAEGILASVTENKIHVSLTTIQPATSDTLKSAHQQRGCYYIAAPVVGRPDAALAGELITFLAGDLDAIERIQPIVNSYTVKQVSVGETASSASAMKICVNYMAMTQLAMLGEIFTYAEKSELDKATVLTITKMFFSGNQAMCNYAEKIANRDFNTAGFDLSAGLKDALIFETAFATCGVKPSTILGAKDNLIVANENGWGDKDWSALTEVSRMLAGLKE